MAPVEYIYNTESPIVVNHVGAESDTSVDEIREELLKVEEARAWDAKRYLGCLKRKHLMVPSHSPDILDITYIHSSVLKLPKLDLLDSARTMSNFPELSLISHSLQALVTLVIFSAVVTGLMLGPVNIPYDADPFWSSPFRAALPCLHVLTTLTLVVTPHNL